MRRDNDPLYQKVLRNTSSNMMTFYIFSPFPSSCDRLLKSVESAKGNEYVIPGLIVARDYMK